jgi:hypothetical protein
MFLCRYFKGDYSVKMFRKQKSLIPINLQLDFTEFVSTEYVYGEAKVMIESFGNVSTNEILFHASANIFIERLKLEQNGKLAV